eukprot:jgi/Mesvir1/25108/Mv21571-RA.1
MGPESDAPVWQHDMYDDGRAQGGRAAGPGAPGRANIETGTKLIISNLDYGVSNEDIKDLFGSVGDLKRATLHFDRSGRSNGTAEVVFSRRSDALLAIKRYNNVCLDGVPMSIALAPVDTYAGQERGGQRAGGGRGGNWNAGPAMAPYQPPQRQFRGGAGGGPVGGAPAPYSAPRGVHSSPHLPPHLFSSVFASAHSFGTQIRGFGMDRSCRGRLYFDLCRIFRRLRFRRRIRFFFHCTRFKHKPQFKTTISKESNLRTKHGTAYSGRVAEYFIPCAAESCMATACTVGYPHAPPRLCTFSSNIWDQCTWNRGNSQPRQCPPERLEAIDRPVTGLIKRTSSAAGVPISVVRVGDYPVIVKDVAMMNLSFIMDCFSGWERIDQLSPSELPYFVSSRIRDIAGGGSHVALITEEGEVWGWGACGGGICPCSPQAHAEKHRPADNSGVASIPAAPRAHPVPQRIVMAGIGGSRSPFVVRHVAAGWAHTAFVTDGGTVFTSGNNQFGQLGLGHLRAVSSPEHVASLAGRCVATRVACGLRHTLVAGTDPQTGAPLVFAFGTNRRGQLGCGLAEQPSDGCQQPTNNSSGCGLDERGASGGGGQDRKTADSGDASAARDAHPVAREATGGAVAGDGCQSTCVRGTGSPLLSCRGDPSGGDPSGGHAGTGGPTRNDSSTAGPEGSVYGPCSGGPPAAVKKEGRSGRGKHPGPRAVACPVRIAALDGVGVRQLRAGGERSALLTDSGGLLMWGRGLGYAPDALVPSAFPGVDSARAWAAVALGWGHIVLLAADGTVWTAGDNRHGQLGWGSDGGDVQADHGGEGRGNDRHQGQTSDVGDGREIDRAEEWADSGVSGQRKGGPGRRDGYGTRWHDADDGGTGSAGGSSAQGPQGMQGMQGVQGTQGTGLHGDRGSPCEAVGMSTGGGRPDVPLRRVRGALPPGARVVDVAAGSEHSVALTDAGQVFVWGWGEHGQLGRCTTANATTPQFVPLDHSAGVAGATHHPGVDDMAASEPSVRTMARPSRVFCGCGFTLALAQ